jgi:exonuclease III
VSASFGHGFLRLPSSRGGVALTATTPPEDGTGEFGGGPPQALPQARIISEISPPAQIGASGRKMRANIKIATLNMNGRRSQKHIDTLGKDEINKWKAIRNTMREKKIGILALQETHLDEEMEELVKHKYEKWLLVFSSADTDKPSAAGGVAFVINKEMISIEEIRCCTIIPGRALLLEFKWFNNRIIRLLNVYASNILTEHKDFWKEVTVKIQHLRTPSPDFMMGDFNMVEELIDRFPLKADLEEARTAIKEFRNIRELIDVWRNENPNQPKYTWRRTRVVNGREETSQSRLDRIYVKAAEEENTFEWKHQISEVPTDHDMVSVRFAPFDAPEIGQGRPSMPTYMLHNENFMRRAEQEGAKILNEFEDQMQSREGRTALQKAFAQYKNATKREWIKEAKNGKYRIDTHIQDLEKKMETLVNSPDFNENYELRRAESELSQEIRHLLHKRRWKLANAERAKWAIKSETMCKEWVNTSKDRAPRDVIKRLKKPSTGDQHIQYTTKSREMTEIARAYHENIQQEGLNETQGDPGAYTETIRPILKEIPDEQKLTLDQQEALDRYISETEVNDAINQSQKGKAAGLDGIPSEFWKELSQRY